MTYDWRIGEKSKQWIDNEVQDTVCHAEQANEPDTASDCYGNSWYGMPYGYINYLTKQIPEVNPILKFYINGHGDCRAVKICKSHPKKLRTIINSYEGKTDADNLKFIKWLEWWMKWSLKNCENPVIIVS